MAYFFDREKIGNFESRKEKKSSGLIRSVGLEKSPVSTNERKLLNRI